MTEFPFLNEIGKQFQLDAAEQTNRVVLKSRNSYSAIEVSKEVYSSSNGGDGFLRYTVSFSTQHRHFDCWQDAQGLVKAEELREVEAEVETYIRQILLDKVLPIEFYNNNQQFGSELTKDEYKKLSVELLSGKYGCFAENLSQFSFEIHSWSGQYDVKRTPVTELPLRKG